MKRDLTGRGSRDLGTALLYFLACVLLCVAATIQDDLVLRAMEAVAAVFSMTGGAVYLRDWLEARRNALPRRVHGRKRKG